MEDSRLARKTLLGISSPKIKDLEIIQNFSRTGFWYGCGKITARSRYFKEADSAGDESGDEKVFTIKNPNKGDGDGEEYFD